MCCEMGGCLKIAVGESDEQGKAQSSPLSQSRVREAEKVSHLE